MFVVRRLGGLGGLVGAAGAAGAVVAALALPVVGGFGVLAEHTAQGIQPVELKASALPQRSVIEASDGSPIATFFTQDRVDVPLTRVSPTMQRAIVAIEDSRFWTNGPLDLRGTLRALVHNGGSGQVQGASTLVQQYVKNVLEDDAAERMSIAQDEVNSATSPAAKKSAENAYDAARDAYDAADAPNVGRKITELRYAIWVEDHSSKQQILDDYLNAVWFGGYQVYGVEAAAEYYFGIPASRLNLPQSAMLAGMVNNAGYYDPVKDPSATRNRRDTVLAAMVRGHDITQAQATRAAGAPLGLHLTSAGGSCESSPYPFFCEYVEDEILNDQRFGSTTAQRSVLLNTGGLTVHTTLNLQAQTAAQHAMSRLAGPAMAHVGTEVMVEPGTGAIEAIAQSRAYGYGRHQTTYDYAVDAAHGGGDYGVQAGSSFKLFTLLAALQQGIGENQRYPTPWSVSLDGFRGCDGAGLGPWSPHNDTRNGPRSADLTTATWQSINTYYARLEQAVGVCSVARMAVRLGMVNPDDDSPLDDKDNVVPSYTLGSNGIDILHEDAAYAAVAARGIYCSPVAIVSMTTTVGGATTPLTVPAASCHRAISADVADEATRILQGVLTRGTAAGNGLEAQGRESAGKTGTTDDEAEAIFAGYTPNLAAEVWFGDPNAPNGDPAGQFGQYDAPYWRMSMLAALRGRPIRYFTAPGGRG